MQSNHGLMLATNTKVLKDNHQNRGSLTKHEVKWKGSGREKVVVVVYCLRVCIDFHGLY
jgi:hypothetical protein